MKQSREPTALELGVLVRETIEAFGGPREFKPFVLYQESLDTIRVGVEDCSMKEVMVGKVLSFLTLCERNYPENGFIHVGFNVECARRFCDKFGIPWNNDVKVSVILKKMAEIDPSIKSAVMDVALPMLERHNIDQVEFLE